MIKSLSGKDSVENVKKDIDEIETINIELEHSVAKLLFENENLRKEREHLKSSYKDQFDSIRKTRVQSKEHCDSLISQINAKSVENSDLNAQLQEKTCPNSPKPSGKLVVVTPMNNDKRVRFVEPVTSSSNIPKQTDCNTPIFNIAAEANLGSAIFKSMPLCAANEVLVTKGALQSEVGHLDMLEHEVGRLCDEYAWWKLTRRCWNTHVLAAAAIGTKGEMWSLNQPRNGTRSLISCLRE
ncbi:hypothetical protein Tco_1161122 [Tanacetum coccineum]